MRIRVIKPNAPKLTRRLRVCAYVRVSTDSDEQEGSLDNQAQYFTDYINANPAWEFVGIYADRGISGFKENRPEFQRMLADARAGKIDLIVVKSISRFARNTETTLNATRELKSLGIGVFFQLQNINTLTTSGELLMTIQGAFAQAESEGASQVGKMVYQRKFSQGIRSHASAATYAFKVDEYDELTVVPEEAKVVKLMFDLAEQGVWASKIKEKLNRDGIPSPKVGKWTDSQIARVLRNVMYKGDIILQKTYKDSHRVSKRNKGEADQWYIADDHPAIVDPAQWERVQTVLAERREHLDTPLPPAPLQPRPSRTQYPLTNMLYCPYCGEKLLHKWSNGSREYWACKTNIKVSATACKGVWLPAAVADAWGVTEPVTVVPYKDKNGMNRFTAFPKDEYDASEECPYRKED
ncbi:MAG: recombinase family protein [Lachnospiraceae bacterium]|nr:recombinase family protein [Lachnospiraceae bacterium]